MKVRLKDIADVTGFSLMTVSLALNPRKSGSRISDETRKKIIQVAREMNYTPNMSARILSGGRSNVVGVMFNANVDGFYSELQLRIDKALGERGYTGLYTFWRGYDEFDRALEVMRQFNVCGILTGHDGKASFPKVPVLCYGVRHDDFESIYPCENEMIRCAVEYAVDQGYSRIGFVGQQNVGKRDCAFKSELKMRGLEEAFFSLEKRDENVSDGVTAFLKSGSNCEVLIFCNDQKAMEWMAELQSRGIRIPEDVKVIGINNVKACQNVTPRLTSVDFGLEKLGDILVKRLFCKCNTTGSPREDIKLAVRIVERDSCPPKNSVAVRSNIG